MDFWEMSKRHFWKKSRQLLNSFPKKRFFEFKLDFFQEWRLLIFRLLDFFFKIRG